MYEDYTKQSLPSKEYRELLGSAICVFNSNNSFIIEIILRDNKEVGYTWYELIDRTSGKLLSLIKETINEEIAEKFKVIINIRNRIIHSFQTNEDGEEILATKDKQNEQTFITREYLLNFIKLNEELSDDLYAIRGH